MDKTDKGRANLNKLRDYRVPEIDESEIRRQQDKKNRYLRRYLKNVSERTVKESVYDPKSLDEFFKMHEAAERKVFEQSRRLRVENTLAVKFQAGSLLIALAALVLGAVLLRMHSTSGYRPAAYIGHIMLADASAAPVPVSRVSFDDQVYEAEGAVFQMAHINKHEAGLPSGSEAAALAMLLSRYRPRVSAAEAAGFLEKRRLVNQDGVWVGHDPAYYYIGDPEAPEESTRGLGVFAPGLAAAANRAMRALNIRGDAQDISGVSEAELFEHAARAPVIVWVTADLEPSLYYVLWQLADGTEISYPMAARAVVLAGYTDTDVIIYDPAHGVIERDRELFLRRWGEIGPSYGSARQAVVIN